jgi:hypothetical protein
MSPWDEDRLLSTSSDEITHVIKLKKDARIPDALFHCFKRWITLLQEQLQPLHLFWA